MRRRRTKNQEHDTSGAVPTAEAKELILRGRAPEGLTVRGHLDLSNNQALPALPAGLTVNSLDLGSCHNLRSLPASLRVRFELNLSACTGLEALPPGLCVGSLDLSDCTGLRALPEGLDTRFLDISRCTRLETWPQKATVRLGRLAARGCAQISCLPGWLTDLAQLDVSDCTCLETLPETLRVSAWIDVADTQIRSLPPALQDVQLLWHGMPIDHRIAFHPETITAQDVLDQRNIELRRLLLERMGYEAFVEQTRAEILDLDYDSGGSRRLLRISLEDDEPLVCVAVVCPSTGQQYIIRVPPHMRTCRQAIAWTAGFENPDDYYPLVET